jgi:hypothetical protein
VIERPVPQKSLDPTTFAYACGFVVR